MRHLLSAAITASSHSFSKKAQKQFVFRKTVVWFDLNILVVSEVPVESGISAGREQSWMLGLQITF